MGGKDMRESREMLPLLFGIWLSLIEKQIVR